MQPEEGFSNGLLASCNGPGMIEAIQLFSYVSKCGLHVYNVNEKCKIKYFFWLRML